MEKGIFCCRIHIACALIGQPAKPPENSGFFSPSGRSAGGAAGQPQAIE